MSISEGRAVPTQTADSRSDQSRTLGLVVAVPPKLPSPRRTRSDHSLSCWIPSACLRRSPSAKCLKVICPPLHQLDTLRKPLGSVVCVSDVVSFFVRQLLLDGVRSPAGLIGTGRKQRSKSMRGGDALVAKARQCAVQSAITQRLARVERGGEHQIMTAAHWLHALQDGKRLR